MQVIDNVQDDILEKYREVLTPICDFCGQTPVASLYVTNAFILPSIKYSSPTSGWAACQACTDDIEYDSRETFLERAMVGSVDDVDRKNNDDRSKEVLKELHEIFLSNIIGEKIVLN